MTKRLFQVTCLSAAFLVGGALEVDAENTAAAKASSSSDVVLPMDRTAYFVGEQVPLAIAGSAEVKLDAVNADGRTPLYAGKAGALWLDTAHLAPGDYALELNGARVVERFTLTSPLRRSAASMQDEATPVGSSDDTARIFTESGLTACFAMGASDTPRIGWLDAMARTGAILLLNPDTRPTSFFPVGNNPAELDGLSQRMILTAQANGRYPNFGGFCYGWDTTGYAVGGRRGLITYWGWGDQTQALRNYIEHVDQQKMDEFTRRTGLKPVTEPEYIAYLLSIKRPEFAPAIDLPTKLWLEEIGRHTQPLADAQRAEFEKRLDAWSAYLMGLYNEAYSTFCKNLAAVDPSLHQTASVQIDHCATRMGQYFPSAYAPLDFRYQSTWNDQFDGPDYAYQWLLTAGLISIQRGDKPVWISNVFGTVHQRATIPGKFLKVAAHNLAWGGSGIGFAAEGFSNLLGGMNKEANWDQIKGKTGEMDVRAGREFLDRFACLATEGRGDHGVGVLFSKSQTGRQNIVMSGFAPQVEAFIALVRLGYTPRFVTEEQLAADGAKDVKALVVIGQQFPMPDPVMAGLAAFVKGGGRIAVDGSTTLEIPGAEKIDYAYPLVQPGKPHNWTAHNLIGNDNTSTVFARLYAETAPAFEKALGSTGRGIFRPEKGVTSDVTLTQISGGADAKYVIAVNDSYVQTQADWYQVHEQLTPSGEGWLYDCTEEKSLGKIAPLACDLTQTTARVYAVLPRELKNIALEATQSVAAGSNLGLRLEFRDADQKRLAAVLPFVITLHRPGGQVQQTYYRSTTPEGTFAITLPVAANAPAGQWSVTIRSQLNGDTATLPITVTAPAGNAAFASAIAEPVIVRNHDAAEAMLAKGAKVVLPVFDAKLQSVAERVKAVLAQRGVTVDIWQNPTIAVYTLGYDPTAAQLQENTRIDAGAAIGRLSRTTINANDWYSGMSGYRFGGSLILLDLATPAPATTPPPPPAQKPEHPMVGALDADGLLWPQVSESFPGNGRAVVQAVPWAFGARTTTLVIQAADVPGLLAGAESLARLPEDRITSALAATRAAIWREYHIGGTPPQAAPGQLTANGAQTGHAPEPFALRFVGNDKPLPANQIKHPGTVVHEATPLPATFAPTQCVLYYHDGDKLIETATVEPLMPDLRFSEALMLPVDAKQAGKVTIDVTGSFRYSDRDPCWQPQWEDILNLRAKLVPKERKPVEMLVQIDGKPAGKLVAAQTGQKEVLLESTMSGQKPKTAVEEVVTQIKGTVDLPAAGRHEIMLIEQNIVDGKLEKISVGAPTP